MSRNTIQQAIILKTNRIGEINKGVVLLTRTSGIINTVAYGACKMKSRLRAYTQLFSHVKVYLYHNPVSNTFKITDMEHYDSFHEISGSVRKFYCASLCAEVILKSYGGGVSADDIFSLFLESLTCLAGAGEESVIFITIQFLFRFLIITGHGMRIDLCAGCGADIAPGETAFHEIGRTGFLCHRCRGAGNEICHPGMRKYLSATMAIPFRKAMDVSIDASSARTLKTIIVRIIETLLEVSLKTVKSGEAMI
ncbi:MAG: DNA repair protein RecO [Spirochaetales bacterium]|nr:DNA repair protein RecO [Spirochaetales bacterium]